MRNRLVARGMCMAWAFAAISLLAAAPGVSGAEPPLAAPAEGEWFNFAERKAIPAYLRVEGPWMLDADGLHGHAFTADSDLIDHDFVLDVMLDPTEHGRRSLFDGADVTVGIGLNVRVNTDQCWRSVALRFRGPHVARIESDDGQEFALWRIEAHRGAAASRFPMSVIRLEKKGRTLWMSVCVGYDGTFVPRERTVIDDLPRTAPFLSAATSNLFFASRRVDQYYPAFVAVRLAVDGKAVDPSPGAPATTKPAAMATPTTTAIPGTELDDSTFFRFTPTSGIPGYLTAEPRDAVISPRGLHGRVVTMNTDYIQHDFTLDVMYQFNEIMPSDFDVGIGESEHLGFDVFRAACARLHSFEHRAGKVSLALDGQFDGVELGSIGRNRGPHVVRIQKVGNTFAAAVCVNYQGTFRPTFSKTLRDLRAVAPYLNERNSALFISHEGGEWANFLAVRLVVDGKLVSPMDGMRPSGTVVMVSPPPATTQPAPTTRPAK